MTPTGRSALWTRSSPCAPCEAPSTVDRTGAEGRLAGPRRARSPSTGAAHHTGGYGAFDCSPARHRAGRAVPGGRRTWHDLPDSARLTADDGDAAGVGLGVGFHRLLGRGHHRYRARSGRDERLTDPDRTQDAPRTYPEPACTDRGTRRRCRYVHHPGSRVVPRVRSGPVRRRVGTTTGCAGGDAVLLGGNEIDGLGDADRVRLRGAGRLGVRCGCAGALPWVSLAFPWVSLALPWVAIALCWVNLALPWGAIALSPARPARRRSKETWIAPSQSPAPGHKRYREDSCFERDQP